MRRQSPLLFPAGEPWRRLSGLAVGLAVGFITALPAEASNTGAKTAGAIVSAGTNWNNFTVARLATANNSRATNGTNNDFGIVSTFGFGVPTLPAGVTISGITASITGSNSAAGTVDFRVELSWDNGASWTAARSATFAGTTDALQTLGGTADTWGRSWTPAEFSDATFQLRIYRSGGAASNLRIDQILVAVEYLLPANLTQGHYRWRNDDGSEAAASWAAPEDTLLPAVPRGVVRRLRFELSNEGETAANVQYQLQVGYSETCAAASYVNVPVGVSGQDWQVAASPNVTDGAATTNVAGGVTDEAATFVAGQVRDAANPTGAVNLAGDQFTEIEFAVQANASAATGGSYCFRLYDSTNSRVLDSYSSYAQARVASGSPMRVRTGSYVGDGASPRAIVVGFRPDAVIVKGDLDEYAVIRTATMPGSVSRSIFWDASDPQLDAIRSLDASGFSVGADTQVNSTGVTYYWTAFEAGSGEMAIGTYDGNDVDNRPISGLGFQPEYVLVVSGGGASWPIHRFSAHAAGASMTVEGGARANAIKNFVADGFELGVNSEVNDGLPLTRYHWLAFNHVPGRVHVSSYTGDGAPSQAITAPGFTPEYVLLTRDALSPARQKPASIGATSNLSHPWGGYPAATNETDVIQTVLPNGFQAGPSDNSNKAGTSYYYLAIAAVRLEQVHARWRNDDGSEAAATWAAAEDTALSGLATGTTRRLRFEVSNEGALASDPTAYALQVAETATCATGAYSTVAAAPGGPWQIVDSASLTDGSATTNVASGLTDEGATFVAGQVKDAGGTTGAITLGLGQFTEVEFALQATASATPGGSYCFRLYDTTASRPLDGYSVYAQASLPSLALADLPGGQLPDQFATATPVTAALFQFRLSRSGSVTVDTLRVRFTTTGGVANGDVSAGELWGDTNGNSVLDGGDTLIQGGVAPAGGVLTFTTDFSPVASGMACFVRATVANLVAGDTTTFSLTTADVDPLEAGVAKSGSVSNAVHVQDSAVSGGDIYYSVGTSAANLRTGVPFMQLNNGTATLTVAQTGYIGVGDAITYGGPATAYIKAVLSPTQFVVQTATGAMPAPYSGVVVSITRAFNTIAAAESGSTNAAHLNTTNLVTGNYRLYWVCYNDGPFNVAATTTIAGYTTDATHYITLTVAGPQQTVNGVNHRHDGTAGSGVVVELTAALDPAFDVAQAYTRFEWLEIDGNDLLGETAIVTSGGGDHALFQYLLLHNLSSTNAADQSNGIGILLQSTLGLETIRNSFIYDFDEDGIDANSPNGTIQNVTIFRTRKIANGGEGIQVGGGRSATATNVLSMVNALGSAAAIDFFSGGTLTCTNCISADGTADDFGGSGNLVNKSIAAQFTATTAGAVDLHLKAYADAIGAGADLSGSFTDDIDGETRSGAWDVGADERLSVSAQMLVKSGSYTGNAVDGRAIDVGFQPDVVIVKNDATRFAHVRTSTMTGDMTKPLDNGGAATYAGGIKALTSTGFVLGTDPNVNGAGTFYWVAFKAAAGELKLGSYTGNNADNRSITGVGFKPDMVMLLPEGGFEPSFHTSSMNVDETYNADSAASTDRIQSFEPDGFQVGASTAANQTGGTFHYVAWNTVPGRVAIGSYTGNGALNSGTTQQISVGFTPEWALLRRADTNRPWIHKPASSGPSTNYSIYLADFTGINNDLQYLQPLGFQVVANGEGANDRANQTGVKYHYAAFGPHATTTNYRSIGTAASYSTGTLAAASGSATLTGSGTSWAAANRGRGDVITIPCPNPPTCTGGAHYTVLSVDSNTGITLTSAFTGTSGSGLSYLIRRQFTTLDAWESCIDASGACTYFPVASSSLVADDRKEVGIAYKDSVFTLGGTLQIDGSTTDPAHDITLTADAGNRHNGVHGAGLGVIVDVNSNSIRAPDAYVTFEWLELRNGGPRAFHISTPNATPNKTTIRYCLFASSVADPLSWFATGHDVDVYNNIFIGSGDAIDVDQSVVNVYNNTFYGLSGSAVVSNAGSTVTLRNNLALGCSGGCYAVTGLQPASSHNIASDATGTTASPAGGGLNNSVATASPTVCGGGNCVGVTSLTAGSENLHLIATSYTNRAADTGATLSSLFTRDIDYQVRPLAGWDVGADERDAATAVRLAAFAARPFAGAVRVEWETALEVDNLGFHLYRALSEAGPWTRLTATLVAGLGSSPSGRAYSWLDAGLTNGVRYYYRLEDVDTRSKATSHGPVSAVPDASLADPVQGQRDTQDEARDGKGRDDAARAASCPAWVLAAYGQSAPSDAAPPRCTPFGKPEQVSLEVLQHGPRGALLELETGGFYAVHEADGSVRLFIPGFDTPDDPQAPALPLRRALVEAVAGRTVTLVSAEGRDLVSYHGLTPAAVGVGEIEVSRLGAIRGARRVTRPVRFSKDFVPRDVARLAAAVFQGETKSGVVELTPLRYDGARGDLVLARRVRVRLSFAGRDVSESRRGRRPPRPPVPKAPASVLLLAQLHSAQRGLHAVAFEQLPAGTAPVPVGELGLQIQGEPVAVHVEPASATFGPGSVLYFHSDRRAASIDFTGELAFELVRSTGGPQLATVSAAPAGAASSPPDGRADFEVNAMYVAGLADAPDVWLWDGCVSGGAVTKTFALPALDAASSHAGSLTVYLQGGSESGQAIDHHLVVSLAGVPLGETSFAGKRAISATFSVPPGLLQAGTNSLHIQNVADTGVSSAVYIDRFSLAYPKLASLRDGRFEGAWSGSGTVELSGVTGAVALLDVTQAPARWLTGYELAPPVLRFHAEAGHQYLAVSGEGLVVPRVQAPPASALRSASNQADYLLIAPSAFLAAAQPLVDRRNAQGLAARAVSFEEIAQVFGHGRPSAEAIREFLAYAFQSWSDPAPRYAVLLGDATSDPQRFLATSRPSPLPALWTRTAFLLTVSDTALAAVNGEDALPDLAIGRLPASTVEEAQALVAKLLAWEDSGQGLSGAAALVADNPDPAGDFEANATDIAQSFLAGHDPSLLFLSRLGGAAGARPAIRAAFDSGLSLISYAGHGASAIWATENIWNSRDALSLQAQSRQPLLLTLNCMNGYFVLPTIDSLAESLVKPADRGAIAAFAPSGLSLDVPAHQYHRALMAELTSGRHERLGDVILAAQRTYAGTGLMPELLGLYQLLGDPALNIR